MPGPALPATNPPAAPVAAAVAVVPNARRTPASIPLLLRVHNTTGRPVRLLSLFAQKDLPSVVHFDLEGPAVGYVQQSGSPSGQIVYRSSGLDYQIKADLWPWQYVYVTVRPHGTFEARFDLARMTRDGIRIPPGRYRLSGSYGTNMGYAPGARPDPTIFNGVAAIPAIDLTVEPDTPRPGPRRSGILR